MGVAELPPGVPAHWGDALDPAPRRVLPLLVWCGSLLLALALLLAVDSGEATPGLTDLAGWRAWLGARPVEQGAFVLARLLALAVAWYLVGVTAVAVLARLADRARLVRVADLLAVGPVRTLAQQALGTGLAIGVLGTAVPTLPPAPAMPVVQDAEVAGEPTTPVVPTAAAPDTARPSDAASAPARADTVVVGLPVPGPVGMSSTDAAPTPPSPVDAVGTTTPAPAPTAPPSSVAPAPSSGASDGTDVEVAGPAAGGAAAREHTVAAGDHLWALAATAVAEAAGATPSEAAIHAHWQRVVDANTARLVDPDNPDLLLPGQVVVLPAVSS